MNATLRAFDYPASLLAETEHWAILLRPKQVTLGSLVLAIRDPEIVSMGALSPQAAVELPIVTRAIEAALKLECKAEMFNYLCLMMVDPQVHFHVLPRYSKPVRFAGQEFRDENWPGPPDIIGGGTLLPATKAQLLETLKQSLLNRLVPL